MFFCSPIAYTIFLRLEVPTPIIALPMLQPLFGKMRLINVKTYELKEFFTEKAPPYAILSHTWGPEEVTFQDWTRPNDDRSNGGQSIKYKAGFQKIMGACCQAKKDNLEWLWCDTNCIDKSSSAELTEAINSMFAWYRFVIYCINHVNR